MKLPNFRRLYESDFGADYKVLIQGLSVPFNNSIEVLYQALNGKITLSENIACTLKQVDVQVDSSGLVLNGASFKTVNNLPVIGLQVIEAINQTNNAVYPTGGIFATGTQTNNGFVLQHVTGLPTNNVFRLRIVAYN